MVSFVIEVPWPICLNATLTHLLTRSLMILAAMNKRCCGSVASLSVRQVHWGSLHEWSNNDTIPVCSKLTAIGCWKR